MEESLGGSTPPRSRLAWRPCCARLQRGSRGRSASRPCSSAAPPTLPKLGVQVPGSGGCHQRPGSACGGAAARRWHAIAMGSLSGGSRASRRPRATRATVRLGGLAVGSRDRPVQCGCWADVCGGLDGRARQLDPFRSFGTCSVSHGRRARRCISDIARFGLVRVGRGTIWKPLRFV